MTTSDPAPDRHRLRPLALGMLAPPVIWAARIGASYVLVPYVCARDATLLLQMLTLGALLGIAWAGVVAWRSWKATSNLDQVEFGGTEARARFMALAGMLSSVLFFAVVVAEGLAVFMVDPCQTGGVPL